MTHWLATADAGDAALGILVMCIASGGILWLLVSLLVQKKNTRGSASWSGTTMSDDEVIAVVTTTVIAATIVSHD
jgi:hypothetical protein